MPSVCHGHAFLRPSRFFGPLAYRSSHLARSLTPSPFSRNISLKPGSCLQHTQNMTQESKRKNTKTPKKNAVRALKNCRKRRMGTSTVLSAMEWRQPSRLPTTSSGVIWTPACKLHKHQPVSSGLSHLIKRVV